jgi:3-deoxy-D-manno-octulosonic-acid transferase
LASARISPRSVNRYRRLGALFRDALAHGSVIAAQGDADADRFRSLGADPARTHVMGNIKFDLGVPADIIARGQLLRARYAHARPMWVAGSTHGGEEELVLEAHRLVRAVHPRALLVLAPRHPNRFDAVAQAIQRSGAGFVRRSDETGDPDPAAPGARPGGTAPLADAEVLLVDTLGELLDFYAASDVAFVGGSLVRIGGHNLVEPAAVGLPILTGPHNSNSGDIARLLIARGAAEQVRTSLELGTRVAALLAAPDERVRMGEAGRACVEGNRGALAKLLSLIEPLLRADGRSG